MKSFIRKIFCVGVLLGLALSVNIALAQPGFKKALDTQRANNGKLFKNEGIVATGISLDQDGNACIKVYVKNAKVKGVPALLNGVRVAKSVSGEFTAWDDAKKQARGGKKPGSDGGGSDDPKIRHARPVPIGVSVGSSGPNYCFAGTLGCRLQRINLDGTIDHFILSNNHVLAEENAGQLGDLVIQPGTLDNSCVLDTENDMIGALSDFEPIRFNGQTNYIDAAIATTTTAHTGFASPSSAYGAPTSNSMDASVGQLVKKYGRTTGYTEGIVDSVNVTVNVGYDAGTATFVDQVVIQGRVKRGKKIVAGSFSDGGDSGSLIVSQNGNDPVGLLFAGNTSFTIANPINAVLDHFSDSNSIMIVDDGN